MQVTEASMFGLRSAIMKLSHSSHGLQFTLIPMIHSAEKEFYDQVSKLIQDSDYSIQEGVKATSDNLTYEGDLDEPHYSDISTNRFGLIDQPDFALKGVKILNFDSSSQEIIDLHDQRDDRSLFKKTLLVFILGVGLFGRFFISIFKMIQRLSLYFLKSRKMLAKYLVVDTSRPSYLDETTKGFVEVLLERDSNLHINLQKFIAENNAKNLNVTIVYGAAHMPGIYKVLKKEGYRVHNSDWIQVFAA